MKNMMMYGCALAGLASIAQADLYRVTMSGQVSSFSDTRTSGDDVFDGTAWDVDSYTPSVGDEWSYEVIYDTDIDPDDFNDQGDFQFSIYGAYFASSISLNGNAISGFNSITNFIEGDVEIFGGLQLGGGHFDVYAFFTRQDGLDDLINGGMLPTSEAFFDGLGLNGLLITNEDNFEVVTGTGEPFSVTVEQIPAPGTLAMVGLGGLIFSRRWR